MSRKNQGGSSKILVIVGPTASGKSGLAVRLARRLNGEVISADSRQVYRGLDIGTGKMTKREMRGVRHHLLDVADPRRRFTAERYRQLARKAIADIMSRGKLPIVCGGTGFYVDAIFKDQPFPAVKPDKKLRRKLSNKTAPQLLAMLTKIDPGRARTIASSDSERNNKRRLIRAVEIAMREGAGSASPKKLYKSKVFSRRASQLPGLPEAIFIGIKPDPDTLKRKIHTRLIRRLRHGMVAEVRRLHMPPPAGKGLSWRRLDELGLEYRYIAQHLQGELTKSQLVAKLDTEIWHYAKRQMTWFKRDKRLKWLSVKPSIPQLTNYVNRAIM